MSEKRDELQAELDNNYEALQKKLPEIIELYRGKFALMRRGEIVEYYDTARDAYATGRQLFDDDLFSVQEITDIAANLGFYSYAVSQR